MVVSKVVSQQLAPDLPQTDIAAISSAVTILKSRRLSIT